MVTTSAGPAVTLIKTSWPDDVKTLAVDVGGSGIKASMLDHKGSMLTDRIRIDTPYPCPPEVLIRAVVDLVEPLPEYHRASVGFPGLVRHGRVIFVPNLSRLAPGQGSDPEMQRRWFGFDLASALTEALKVPTKVANDADVQGCAVVEGKGFEFVMTLGTGTGTALFSDGHLLPHLELGHAPFRNNESFEQQIGDVARKLVGKEKWQKRVIKAVEAYDKFLFYDRIYIGGGNAKLLDPDRLGPKATIVPNTAGILGGIRIWELDL